jgi:regulatory protein
MPKITALKVQARNKNRVNVYLDGEFAFGLVKIEAVRLRLGQELSGADVERLKQADTAETAYEQALKFISYRPRSESEVRQHLKKKELSDSEIENVLARLRNAGLVNDEAFAKYWVETRAAFRPKGKRALKAELRAKGVAVPDVETALADTNDAEAARQLAVKRAKRLKDLPWPDFRRKLGEYLARRGIDYDTLSEAVERAWRDLHGDGSDINESED